MTLTRRQTSAMSARFRACQNLSKSRGYAGPVPRQEEAHKAAVCQAFRLGCRQPHKLDLGELQNKLETIVIIALVVFLLGGVGWYWGTGAVNATCSGTEAAVLERDLACK